MSLQAGVPTMDGGETSQKCEEKPTGSVLQPRNWRHRCPAWNQLPGGIQWGGPVQVQCPASRGERHTISQWPHTASCHPTAAACCPAGWGFNYFHRPPTEWTGRALWNNQRGGKQTVGANQTATVGWLAVVCSVPPEKSSSLVLSGKRTQYLVPQQRKVTRQLKTGRSVLDHTALVLHSLLCPE